MEPHSPYAPEETHAAPFRLRNYEGDRNTDALLRLGQLGELAPEGFAFLESEYQGEIRQNDAAFGAFLDGLRERGLYDRTLVVFTSDHGEEFVEHSGTGHGKTLYQEVLRVPLVVRPPGGVSNARLVSDIVEQIDLLPTILGYLGVSWSDDLPGRDVSQLLRGGDGAAPPGLLFSEQRFGVVDKYSVRTGSMMLILNNDGAEPGGRFELYDLDRDPNEQTSLIDSHPVTLGYLQRELDRFRDRKPFQSLAAADTELLTDEELDKLRALGYIQ